MFVMNQERTFETPVVVHTHDSNGKPVQGKFRATFKIVKTTDMMDEENADERFLDMILVSVKGLTINDDKGKPLPAEDLLEACKSDPEISIALVSTYNQKITSKNLKKT